MLNNTFIFIDIICINNIPLNNLNEEDCLSWKPNKDRKYTVKYGYHNIMEWKDKQEEECSNKDMKYEV